MSALIYRAKMGFSAVDKKGNRVSVRPGDTAAEGHFVLLARPDAFEPLVVDFDVPVAAKKTEPKSDPKVPAAA